VKVVAIHVAPAGRLPMRLTVDSGENSTRPGDRRCIGEVEVEVVRVAVCRPLTSGTIRVGDAVQLQSERTGA